ncbi:uncharacterized protein [Chiloscyllium punctatum]|uniref:uncharacterized protein isoform X3 n=1 Tax=Chiloscyllium punctatum TaxID=137246 RepID=UPI003B63B206
MRNEDRETAVSQECQRRTVGEEKNGRGIAIPLIRLTKALKVEEELTCAELGRSRAIFMGILRRQARAPGGHVDRGLQGMEDLSRNSFKLDVQI